MLKRDQRSGAEFAAGAQTKPELLELQRLLDYVRSGMFDRQNKPVDRSVNASWISDLGLLVRVTPMRNGLVYRSRQVDFLQPRSFDNIGEILEAAERHLGASVVLH